MNVRSLGTMRLPELVLTAPPLKVAVLLVSSVPPPTVKEEAATAPPYSIAVLLSNSHPLTVTSVSFPPSKAPPENSAWLPRNTESVTFAVASRKATAPPPSTPVSYTHLTLPTNREV